MRNIHNTETPLGLILIALIFGIIAGLWLAVFIGKIIASLLGFAFGFIIGALIVGLEITFLVKLFKSVRNDLENSDLKPENDSIEPKEDPFK